MNGRFNNLNNKTDNKQLDLFKLQDDKFDFFKESKRKSIAEQYITSEISKETLFKFEKDIRSIKNKLQVLKGVSSNHNEKTILQLILPKEVLKLRKDFAINEKNKKRSQTIDELDNTHSKLYKPPVKLLYNKIEESVRKLNLYDGIKDIKKQDLRDTLASKKTFNYEINFKQQIPDFKQDYTRKINDQLSKEFDLSSKVSRKLNLAESKNSNKKIILKQPSVIINSTISNNIYPFYIYL